MDCRISYRHCLEWLMEKISSRRCYWHLLRYFLCCYSVIRHPLDEKELCEIQMEDFHLLMITSESSMMPQFSLQFIFRRFDGEAASMVIDTELVRFAVGVRGVTGSGVGKAKGENRWRLRGKC